MEYVQMTLNDWAEMKQKLKMELTGVKQSFVRIGYTLRKIEDQRLYEQDGYKSVAEFAKDEYGLEPSTTSRFMSINREYSVDGYSEHLRPEFADLGRSQLEEMLKLPESDRQMIQPETPRQDIRDLKKFNSTEPVAGVADDLKQLIENFYKDNPEILNAVFSEAFEEQTIKRFAEIVNPGGNRSYKKGFFFLMMYENRVTVKKFGSTPQDMTWWQFYLLTTDVFGEVAAGDKTWQRYFEKEEQTKPKELTRGSAEKRVDEKEVENTVSDIPEKEIAPAQKSEENQGFAGASEDEKDASEEEQIPGQMEVKDYPGIVPEQEEEDGISGRNRTVTAGSDRNDGEMDNRETGGSETTPEKTKAPQSDEKGSSQKGEEYRMLKKEAERLAHGVCDAFWGVGQKNTIPLEELEKAFENAQKLVQMIEQLISMTEKEKTE